MALNPEQLRALALLNAAITAATNSSLFDEMAAYAHPDTINQFCDTFALMREEETPPDSVKAKLAGSDCPIMVSLDNGETFVPANGVRVHYQDVLLGDGPNGEVHGEVQLNVTSEGIITDIWAGETNVGTDSTMIDDIVARLADVSDVPTPKDAP